MINQATYLLLLFVKTLQNDPLTGHFEGALTNRTIQFSKSSRFLHLKFCRFSPIQGTKNRAPNFFTLTRHLGSGLVEYLIIFRPTVNWLLYFFLSALIVLPRREKQSIRPEERCKSFLKLFWSVLKPCFTLCFRPYFALIPFHNSNKWKKYFGRHPLIAQNDFGCTARRIIPVEPLISLGFVALPSSGCAGNKLFLNLPREKLPELVRKWD